MLAIHVVARLGFAGNLQQNCADAETFAGRLFEFNSFHQQIRAACDPRHRGGKFDASQFPRFSRDDGHLPFWVFPGHVASHTGAANGRGGQALHRRVGHRVNGDVKQSAHGCV